MPERMTEKDLAAAEFRSPDENVSRLTAEVRRLRGIIDLSTRQKDRERWKGQIDLYHEARAIREEE